jgi:hypothetical protein
MIFSTYFQYQETKKPRLKMYVTRSMGTQMPVWIERCERGVFAFTHRCFRFYTTWFCVLAFFLYEITGVVSCKGQKGFWIEGMFWCLSWCWPRRGTSTTPFKVGAGVQRNNQITVENECLVWHYSLNNGRLTYEGESAVSVEPSRVMAESLSGQ